MRGVLRATASRNRTLPGKVPPNTPARPSSARRRRSPPWPARRRASAWRTCCPDGALTPRRVAVARVELLQLPAVPVQERGGPRLAFLQQHLRAVLGAAE